MKIHALVDQDIKKDDYLEVERQFIDIYDETAGITPIFSHETKNFETYPKVAEAEGDEHITDAYLKSTAKEVYDRLGDSIDTLVIWIHRDNWNLEGIWGTAYANIYSGYNVLVCRFDNKNLANALGTLYHESMHPHDSFIQRYLSVNINSLGRWGSWDKHVVHGGRPDQVGKYKWGYIRHMENQDALAYIAVYLRQAYAKRHTIASKRSLVNVLTKLVFAYKALINRKSTVVK